jgi:serine phosphatase RsbU (regulator of sigma subunit)/ligand-binding sensor domain-containing protein
VKHIKTPFFLLLGFLFSSDFKTVEIPGLSSRRSLSAAQDSSGFVWIGTDEGLNKYDGHTNIVYRSNIFDENTISGNRVWITHVDQNNTLWIGTDRGVCHYNNTTDRFVRIKTGSKPVHVFEHEKHIYFTTTNDGVYKIHKTTKSVSGYKFDPLDPFSISSSRFSEKQSKPIEINGETLWVGTTNGLNKVNIKTGQTKRLYSGKTELVKADTVTTVFITNDILFVGSSKGLGVSDLSFGEDLNKNLGKAGTNYIHSIFEIESTGQVCVVSDENIEVFSNGKREQTIKSFKGLNNITDLKTDQFLITSNKKNEGLFLAPGKDGTVLSREIKTPIVAKELFVDNEDGVWVVGNEGILRAGNTKSPVALSLKAKIIEGGFSRHDKNLYFLEKNTILSTVEGSTPRSVVETIETLEKENNKIYAAETNEIYLFDKKILRVLEGGYLDTVAAFNTPINALVSGESQIFVSLKNSGIASVDKTTKKITDYRKNRLLSKLLPSGASCFFLKDSILWIGSDESGLYEVDIKNIEEPKVIKHHTHNKANPRSFSSSSVSCITQHTNLLFVGTSGDGLFLYDGSGFDGITIENGLPSNNIVSLSSASDSTMWSLTNGGLALVNHKNKNISVVSEEEGLRAFYRHPEALISGTNGNVFVVSPKGVQRVVVEDLYTNEYESVVVIESVQLIDKNNKKHPVQKDEIKSTYTKPIIRVNLTSPSMFKANNTTFSYFIEGYHDKWVDNGKRRYIELQGFGAGTYTLQVRSYNNDGYESKNTASINFTIVPPWWKTWWAYLLYIVTTLALFAYYVAYQKRAQAKATEDKRKEEELEQARQFQLDMLPRETPEDLGLDISAAIETASEVGGDYYDYFPQKDKQSLYVVVGDATGHGMTAGMMVSITKAGLYGIPSIPPNDIAKRLNRVIKNIDLGWNRMAFNMARFWDNKVEFTSAAMPPVYHYHSSTGEVDEVLLGGLPLGSIKDETFALEEFDFNIGDSLVFISDGLPEAENNQGEMLGYEAVYDCVKANGKESAEEQKQALLDLGSAWLGELRNQDDITIVVVKKSNPLD